MNFKLFLDCDGVLADFDKRAEGILGMPGRKFEELNGSKALWDTLYAEPDFFTLMDPMEDAHLLVNAVRYLEPTILTGLPLGTWAEPQKLLWRDQHFPDLEMICCPSKDKKLHMVPGKVNIIIDDWPAHAQTWIDAGGIWIMHKTAEQSLVELATVLTTMGLE